MRRCGGAHTVASMSAERKTVEHARLEDARAGAAAWKAWGPVPVRAPVGHGPRGLQRRRRRVELLPARPGALARVPLGRGRDRRDLRRAPAAVPGARAVERRRPDPQGADVRPDQRRGQPRRGRQGVLVLPGLHAHALLPEVPVQVPAAGVPVRRPRRHQRARAASRTCEYELLDTGVFDEDRYFDVVVEYAKAAPDDILMLVTAHNRGPEAATLHLLPTLWFRNTWSWGDGAEARRSRPTGRRRCAPRTPSSGRGGCTSRTTRGCCSARTRRTTSGCSACPTRRPYPKDAINDHVRRAARRSDATQGTKCAAHHVLEIAAGGSATVRVRLTAEARAAAAPLGRDFDRRVDRAPRGGRRASTRRSSRRRSTPTSALVMRQALAGLLWGKQYYEYDVHRWLREHGVNPWAPDARGRCATRALVPHGRRRHHLDAGQVGVPVVRGLGPGLPLRARSRSWTSTSPRSRSSCCCARATCIPTAQIPAYEWNFSDVNPPVTAWAALYVYEREAEIRGAGDREFLQRVFQRLLTQLHLVGQPQGPRRPQPLPGRLPRARQHRHLRPLGAAARRRDARSRPTAPRGWPSTASGCCRSRSSSRARTTGLRRHGAEVRRRTSSGSRSR